jgi:hypothetical protein
MTIAEVVPFLLNLIPFLNTSTIVLAIDLGLTRLGLKITRREYKKRPMRSLVLGLSLIVASGFISLVIQRQLSGLQPFIAFIILLAAYIVLTQAY